MNIVTQQEAHSLLKGKYHKWDTNDTEILKINKEDKDNCDIINNVHMDIIKKNYEEGFDKLEIHSIIVMG
jgi:hypothetical protein